MPKVFLSHKTEEKQVVLKVRDYLEKSLISTWLDEEQMPAGRALQKEILLGLDSHTYFLAFISPRYVRSRWCMEELELAYDKARAGELVLVPILLTDIDTLQLSELEKGSAVLVKTLLDRFRYLSFDAYDVSKSAREIAEKGIWAHEAVTLEPVDTKTIQGQTLQVIQFHTKGDLPTSFLSTWDLNLERNFLSTRESEARPLRAGVPVALNGKGPNWLYSYLAVQFKNLCPVYVYNQRSDEYICVYDHRSPSRLVGTVLKP